MPKLPKLKWRTPPVGYLERLRRWFRLWELEQRLRNEDADYARPSNTSRQTETYDTLDWKEYIADYDPNIAVGDVRLLTARLLPEAWRPVYVAILAEWEGGMFLVAPFGPFIEPATTSEWLTGRTEPPLRVLCLWNARTVTPKNLAQSWRVDHFSETELTHAREVFEHAFTGQPLSDQVLAQVGCPIVHPNDPRILYQDEEARMFSIMPEDVEERLQPEQFEYVNFYAMSEELALAGKSTDTTSIEFAKYAVVEMQLFITLLTQTDGKQVGITVFDQDDMVSFGLDGAQIVARKGQSVHIEKGRAICPRIAMSNGFKLVGANGAPIDIKRVD